MAGELIMLPLRVGTRAANLLLRVGDGVASRAVIGARKVMEVVNAAGEGAPSSSDGSSPSSAQALVGDPRRSDNGSPPPMAESAPAPAESPSPASAETVEAPMPPAVEPSHVSEEPELIREVAEPGAEDGVGPNVTVAVPWEGYVSLSAKQVIARLSSASDAELAAVLLYERGNRGRQTVLAAVERQLQSNNRTG